MKLKFTFLFLVALLFCECKSKSDKIVVDLAITDVTVIDAIDGERLNQDVYILNGRIKNITPANSKVISARKKIDGQGKFLIPGLWDAHIHMAYDTLLSDSMFDLFLRYGVTYIRDTGGKIEAQLKWKEYAEKYPEKSPDYYFSGPLLDGKPTIYDGSSPLAKPLGVGTDDPEKLMVLAEELIDQGVHFLKAYEMLNSECLSALSMVAFNNKLKITGHVPLEMGVLEAVGSGLSSIEHLRNIELACAADWKEMLIQRKELLKNKDGLSGMTLRRNIHQAQRNNALLNQDPERTAFILDQFKLNKTYQIPTLSIMTANTKRHWLDPKFSASFEYVPDTIANRWKSVIPNLTANPPKENDERYTSWLMSMTKKMNDKGIPIMAGTDAPIYFLTPGYSLHTELELLVEAGLSNLEALGAATIVPAKYFNLEYQIGSIKVGKQADLVLLNSNPLIDISNTSEIATVIKGGTIVHTNQQ